MDTKKFLEQIKEKIGGNIDDEVSSESQFSEELGRFPRLLADYKGYLIKFDFIIQTELLLQVDTPPPHRLLVSHETIITKVLDAVCVSPEVRIGDPSFDKKYLIQNANPEIAKQILSDEGRKLLAEFEPFIKFEMTDHEYKLLRDLEKKDYKPDDALADMDKLIAFAELCKKLDFSKL